MTASDTPEVPRNPETHTCWQCGYTWRHGADGSHDCATLLKADRDRLAGLLDRCLPIIQAQRGPEWRKTDEGWRGFSVPLHTELLAEIQAALGRGGAASK